VDRLRFYFRNATLSLLRERRRAVFAVFTVVVGVAAIVGLQLTADILEHSLTTNVRALLRGDLAVTKTGAPFESQELEAVEALRDDALIDGFTVGGTVSDFTEFAKFKLSVVGRTDKDAVLSFYDPLFLERDVYPYYGEVRSGGQGLWDLIQDEFDVVVTRNLANRHDINVNDQLKLGDVEQLFTVKGILSNDALGRSGSPLQGNVVFPSDTIDGLFPDLKDPVSGIYILAPGRSDAELAQIDARLEAISPLVESTTPAELEGDNQDAADALRSVILIFGLVALAIGGIGIANTMQVLVSRRLPEAGVLKALGLKGRQVMAVFLTEALIIGVVGSVVGIVAGVAVSFVMLRVVEGIVFVDLEWSLGAGPVVTGLIVGLLVTLAFGLLPTVGAGRVRPMAAIRPNDSDLIKGSWLLSTLLLLALAVVMGIMVSVLIGASLPSGPLGLPWGLIGTLAAFLAVGVLLLILVGVVYVLSRLPTLRRLMLQLSFLEWRRRKMRAASLLLAMSIGVLGIGLVLMLADTFISGFTGAVEDAVGGDVVLAVNDPAEKDRAFDTIRQAEGVTLFSPGIIYETRLAAIDGDPNGMEDRIRAYEARENRTLDAEDRQNLEDYFSSATVRSIDAALPRLEFPPDGGRMLDESDEGANTVVLQSLSQWPAIERLGLQVGGRLSFQGLDRDGGDVGDAIEFEIVGITEEDPIGVTVFGPLMTANDPFREQSVPPVHVGVVEVEDAKRDDLVRDLNLELDSVLVIEVAAFIDIFAELLEQIRMFPLVLSGLSLLAAVVIIANAVALSTIERRKELGLLKAVGAKARWVTVQLVVENTLLGFVGGLIGLGLAFLVLVAITALLGYDLVTSPGIIV
jgi:ABC-type antimicrobial peptide transport system permease subunit